MNVLLLLTFDEIAQNTLASMAMWEIFSHIAVKVFGDQQLTIGLELSPESGLRRRFQPFWLRARASESKRQAVARGIPQARVIWPGLFGIKARN